MNPTLPPELARTYSLHHARGNWHIGKAWVTSTTTQVGWTAWLMCQIGRQRINRNTHTLGKRSPICPRCKAWLADRIMRQDWS